MNKVRQIFPKKLSLYISKSNKKQSDICKELNISDSSLSEYCSGKTFPRIEIVEKLADYFNINVTDLITEPTQQINNNNITNSNNFNINQYSNVVNENRALLEEIKHLKEENNKLRNNNLSELEIQLLKIYNTLDFKEQIKLLNDLINN